jgi:hypothetical protein
MCFAVPQEVRDLFVRHRGREVFDQVTAAIDEPAIGPIDLADGRLCGDHTLQPRAEFRHDV